MSIKIEGVIEWFERRAKEAPGNGSRTAFLLAIAALREKAEREDPKPFPSYTLSNNNAAIRNTRARIEELEKRQATPAPEGWTFDGGEVIINTEINRLQIVFDERPDYGLKEELKRCGFRWAPSQSAWQRQLTDNAITAAKQITGEG